MTNGFTQYAVILAAVLLFVLPNYSQTAAELQLSKELFAKGIEDYNRGQYDAAIADYTAYIKIRPKQPSAWYNRGIAYKQKAEAAMSRTDFEKAAADLSQAIVINSQNADYMINRGWVYSRLMTIDFNKYLALAVADFTAAIRLEPRSSEAYKGRGMVYEDSNQNAKALPDLDQAIKLDPKDAVTYYTRAKVLGNSKNYKAALADVESALRLFPDYEAAKIFRNYIIEEQNKATVKDPTGISSVVKTTPGPAAGLADVYDRTEAAEKAGNYSQVVTLVADALRLIAMESESLTKNDLETSIFMNLLRKRAKAFSELGKYSESDEEYKNQAMASIRNVNRSIKSANQKMREDKLGSGAGWIMAKLEAFKGLQACRSGLEAGNEWVNAVKRTRPNDHLAALQAGMMYAGVRENCAISYIVYGDYQVGMDGGKANLNKGLNDALASYNEAASLAPNFRRVYEGRAKIYRSLGRLDLAMADEAKAKTLPSSQ